MWLFYVLTGGLLNTKAWGHVTDILGGAVYVVYVDGVEIVRRLDAPWRGPTLFFRGPRRCGEAETGGGSPWHVSKKIGRPVVFTPRGMSKGI
jgi:hypothetical protein